LQRAVALYGNKNPAAVPALLRVSEVHLVKGQYDEADSYLHQALDLDPRNPSVLLGLGLVAAARDDLAASRALLHRVEDTPFTRRKACAQLAVVCQRLGDAEAARKYAQRAATLPPDAHWPDPLRMDSVGSELGKPGRYHAVEHLESQGRYQEAVQQLLDIVADHPDVHAYVGLGLNLERLGNYQAAEEALHTAIELAPDNVQAYYRLSRLAFLQAEKDGSTARYRAAADYARQALTRKPDHAMAQMFLGLALQHLGQHAEARDALRLASECAPQSSDPHFYYGQALAEAGRKIEARAQLEQAVRLAPPGDNRPREALERLEAASKTKE
jgi:tetratricopeptide (TPR) repeat protein